MSSLPPLTAQQQRLLEWSKAQVTALAGYPDDGQVSRYLLSLSSKPQLLDYAHNLFGSSNAVTTFINDLWSRRLDPSAASRPPLQREESDDSTQGSRATSYGVIDNDRPNRPPKASAEPALPPPSASAPLSTAEAFDPARFKSVKIKFAKPKKGQTAAAVVRTSCSCQAREHDVFTNCTVCGRILCVLEGEGDCPYCSSFVTKSHTKPSDAFIQYMESLNTSGRVRKDVPSSTASDERAAAEGLEKAEAQKRKLLGFSAANVARSRVIDQQNDYYEFEANAWLSADAKEAKMKEALQAEEKLHRRRDHTVSIDLVSGRVIAHSSDPFAQENQGKSLHGTGVEIITREDEDRHRLEAVQKHAPIPADSRTAARSGVADPAVHRMFEEMKTVSRAQYFSNDTLMGKARAVYERMQQTLDMEEKEAHAKRSTERRSLFTSRLQHEDDPATATFDQEEAGLAPSLWGDALDDDEPIAPPASFDAAEDDEPDCRPAAASSASPASPPTRDNGTTLSMHQPWASLLVLGIKRFEGRGWTTPFRGRLWIASTAHQCTAEEVEQLEAEYRAVYAGQNIPFPSSYPHSALLGCVDLVDVVAQEEFQKLRRARVEREDSASAFIFVCEHPQVLPLPISITGQHKLWQLPKKLFEGLTAANLLAPVSEKWRTGKSRAKEGEETAGKGPKPRKTLVVKKGPRMPNEK